MITGAAKIRKTGANRRAQMVMANPISTKAASNQLVRILWVEDCGCTVLVSASLYY